MASKKLLKWQICEVSSKRIYTKYTDEQIENRMQFYHQNADFNEIINALFYFKFRKLLTRIFQVYKAKISYFLSGQKF